MNFDWTDEHAAFRQRLRDFLAAHLPHDWNEKSRLDNSAPYIAQFAKTFCPALAKEGLMIPHWPKAVGGGGLDAYHHWILNEEMWIVGEPRAYQYMNVNWIGPSILQYGTAAQIKRHIGRIASGEAFWCQGFSEPSSGSDLYSMRTEARQTDKGWIVNGSKIWTSGASSADTCFLLARTGAGRRDITVFLVPMDTPGIEVRLVPCIVEERSFHEVFFTDVAVGDDCVLGDVSQGNKIIATVLHFERVGSPRYTLTQRAVDHAVAILKRRGRFDAIAQARAGRVRAAGEAARLHSYQVIDGRAKERPPTSVSSLARYAQVMQDRLASLFFEEFLPDVLASGDDLVILAAHKRIGSTGLAAGSAEILLNTIARDVLQLPRE